jgi:phosphatidylinositol phospholipase C beta
MITDEEEESSSAEEAEDDNPSEMKLRLQEKPSSDKVSAAKESEAGAEISALVNYVQPVHFSTFENSESKYLLVDV